MSKECLSRLVESAALINRNPEKLNSRSRQILILSSERLFLWKIYLGEGNLDIIAHSSAGVAEVIVQFLLDVSEGLMHGKKTTQTNTGPLS